MNEHDEASKNDEVSKEIAATVNRLSMEGEYRNTPDFMCGDIAVDMMNMVTFHAQVRDEWYGWAFQPTSTPSAKTVAEVSYQAMQIMHAKLVHTDPEVADCLSRLSELFSDATTCIPLDNTLDQPADYQPTDHERPYRCPACNYTHEDAMRHGDHHICVAKGGPPMPPIKVGPRGSEKVVQAG